MTAPTILSAASDPLVAVLAFVEVCKKREQGEEGGGALERLASPLLAVPAPPVQALVERLHEALGTHCSLDIAFGKRTSQRMKVLRRLRRTGQAVLPDLAGADVVEVMPLGAAGEAALIAHDPRYALASLLNCFAVAVEADGRCMASQRFPVPMLTLDVIAQRLTVFAVGEQGLDEAFGGSVAQWSKTLATRLREAQAAWEVMGLRDPEREGGAVPFNDSRDGDAGAFTLAARMLDGDGNDRGGDPGERVRFQWRQFVAREKQVFGKKTRNLSHDC